VKAGTWKTLVLAEGTRQGSAVKIRRSTPRANALVAASGIVPEAASHPKENAGRIKPGAVAPTERQITETKMRKTVLTILGAVLIAGSAVQMAAASARHYRTPAAASQQFRNANNSGEGSAGAWCSTEPGNPYNPQTDYQGWSAWRQLGAWDSRNDCQ
jgi:hypothetical protein